MKVWLQPDDLNFYGMHGEGHDPNFAVHHYNSHLEARSKAYSSFEWKPEFTEIADQIRNKGHHKVESFFDEGQRELLISIRDMISDCVATNKHIKRRDVNMAFIEQPILNIPDLHKILFDGRIINMAAAYFGCIPALTSVAVRKSFVTYGEGTNNQYFHRDYNSLVKVVKFAIYLNDVDENTGPFGYVETSNRRMFTGWWHHHYMEDWVPEKFYGKENVKRLTANFGDLLMADTRGLHKGWKPIKKERIAIHACFLIHPELTGLDCKHEVPYDKAFQIDKGVYDNLPEWKKPVADFLKKV